MKTVAIMCIVAVQAFVSASSEDLYTDRYDSVNLNEILANRRLLIPYIKCLLDEGRCTAEGKELKSHVREALENNCEKCTEAQKRGTRQVIGHLVNHEQSYWQQLSQKYDPSNKFTFKYEKELRNVAA